MGDDLKFEKTKEDEHKGDGYKCCGLKCCCGGAGKIMVDIDLFATHVKFILYGTENLSFRRFGGLPSNGWKNAAISVLIISCIYIIILLRFFYILFIFVTCSSVNFLTGEKRHLQCRHVSASMPSRIIRSPRRAG